ncbi:MAG: hypothetical protein U0903_18175 [Planctomycetales bacterium]
MWHSLLSSAAKKPNCLLVVLTNAGVGRGWQWQVRENARLSPGWYFSSLEGSQCGGSIRNNWRSSGGAAAAIDPCEIVGEQVAGRGWRICDPRRSRIVPRCGPELPESGGTKQYVAAIDYAEKHGQHGGGGGASGGAGGDRRPDGCDQAVRTFRSVRVAWVDEWLEEIAEKFPGVEFVIDEYQLVGTIQRYEQRFAIQRLAFQGGKGITRRP